MAERPPTVEPHVERPGPAEFRDPLVRREMQKAAVWFGTGLAILGVITLGQPLLLIIGGMIFAVFLDGGVRLVGRYLPIPRPWRLLLVLLLGPLAQEVGEDDPDDEEERRPHQEA